MQLVQVLHLYRCNTYYYTSTLGLLDPPPGEETLKSNKRKAMLHARSDGPVMGVTNMVQGKTNNTNNYKGDSNDYRKRKQGMR